ncbi:MAG TPA: hypothetical protein VFG48_01865 [Xanthomonadales bacterium]|nr:hypothetical protein [Xanthomonadales bacterium]
MSRLAATRPHPARSAGGSWIAMQRNPRPEGAPMSACGREKNIVEKKPRREAGVYPIV